MSSGRKKHREGREEGGSKDAQKRKGKVEEDLRALTKGRSRKREGASLYTEGQRSERKVQGGIKQL
jgi:hypothetical protein